MGMLFFYAGCAVSWSSRLHTYVTTSTNHSEYCALAKAAREAKYINSLFIFMGRPEDVSPIDLFGDNSGAVSLANNVVEQTKTKHVDIADHYSRELISSGVITATRISKKLQLADIFTKAEDTPKFLANTKELTGSA